MLRWLFVLCCLEKRGLVVREARRASGGLSLGREGGDLERAVYSLTAYAEVARGLTRAARLTSTTPRRNLPNLDRFVFFLRRPEPIPRGDQFAALDGVDLPPMQVLCDLGQLPDGLGVFYVAEVREFDAVDGIPFELRCIFGKKRPRRFANAGAFLLRQ